MAYIALSAAHTMANVEHTATATETVNGQFVLRVGGHQNCALVVRCPFLPQALFSTGIIGKIAAACTDGEQGTNSGDSQSRP